MYSWRATNKSSQWLHQWIKCDWSFFHIQKKWKTKERRTLFHHFLLYIHQKRQQKNKNIWRHWGFFLIPVVHTPSSTMKPHLVHAKLQTKINNGKQKEELSKQSPLASFFLIANVSQTQGHILEGSCGCISKKPWQTWSDGRQRSDDRNWNTFALFYLINEMGQFWSQNARSWLAVKDDLDKFESELFMTHDLDSTDTERIQSIIDLKYSKADFESTVEETEHLEKQQQDKRLWVLQKFEPLFDGSPGQWKIPPVKLELKDPDGKPHHDKPCPVLQSQERKLREEVEWQVDFGFSKRWMKVNGHLLPSQSASQMEP